MRGFTLIELMIVSAIIPIMMLAISIPLVMYPRQYKAVDLERQMNEEARSVLKWMGRDIRSSQGIIKKAGPYETGPDTIILKAPGDGGTAKAVVWTTGKFSSENLVRIELADYTGHAEAARLVFAPDKAMLKFEYYEPAGRVGVELTLSRQLMNSRLEESFQGLFTIRRAVR